ncbi:hypothetical protein BDM02DRAFT_3091560, partial [Thelephora ganbajun]
GDIVAVNNGFAGRREGLVVGSHIDHLGRQIIEVQLDSHVVNYWYPQVTRVKRTISYAQPVRPAYRTVERRIVW